jgi:hypothetical protein
VSARVVLATCLFVGALAAGGSLLAAAPGPNDEEIEQLAEAAFEQWLSSQGDGAVGGTLACGVDSTSSHSVYCYAHALSGFVAATAPIPAAGESFQFTLIGGSIGGVGVPVPTSWPATTTVTMPSPTAVTVPLPTSPPKTDPQPTALPSEAPTFSEGLHVLADAQIPPGRYRAEGSDFCYWERLSAPDTNLDNVLANFIATGPALVEILSTDVAFNSSGCGYWAPYAPPPQPVTTFGAGMYVVGSDIAAGTYTAEGGPDCYWRRLSGFSGDFDELLDIDNMTASGSVVIEPTDVGFESSACGTWTLTTAPVE